MERQFDACEPRDCDVPEHDSAPVATMMSGFSPRRAKALRLSPRVLVKSLPTLKALTPRTARCNYFEPSWREQIRLEQLAYRISGKTAELRVMMNRAEELVQDVEKHVMGISYLGQRQSSFGGVGFGLSLLERQ